MELQDMTGDVGIKCPIRQVIEDDEGNEIVINEGVDVVPSRESVRWTPATREFLKKQFSQAQIEATGMIENELKEVDFLKWIRACKNISIYSSGSSAVGRLSKIVDLNTLTPKYSGDSAKPVKFSNLSKTFRGFHLRRLTKYIDKKENKLKIKRDDLVSWNEFDPEKLFFKTDKTKRLTDMYLCDQNGDSIVTISPMTKEQIAESGKDTNFAKQQSQILDTLEYQDVILKLLKESKLFEEYDTVEVPQDYIDSLNAKEQALDTEAEQQKVLTPAEKRKLEQRVVANTLTPNPQSWRSDDDRTYANKKVEPKIKHVADYDGKFFYGFQTDLSKLHLAAHILDVQFQTAGVGFYNDDYALVSISKNNKKYFNMHTHINDFFGVPVMVTDEKNKTLGVNIMFDNAVTKWNTARKLYPHMEKLQFLENFSTFDNDIASDYQALKKFIEDNYAPLNSYKSNFGVKEHYEDFIKFLDAIENLQVFVEEEHSADEITQKVQEIVQGGVNLPEQTTGGIAVDREKIQTLERILAYAKPVQDLLNHSPLLTSKNQEIPLETVLLIDEYLKLKNLKK